MSTKYEKQIAELQRKLQSREAECAKQQGQYEIVKSQVIKAENHIRKQNNEMALLKSQIAERGSVKDANQEIMDQILKL